MTRKYIRYNPNQNYLLPPNPRDWLPEGHLALFLSDTVDGLDLSAIHAYYNKAEAGAPPFHPAMMAKILLYAYCKGIPASRRMATAVEEDVAFRVLAAGNTPDFRTICQFRRLHIEPLKGLFKQVVRLCQNAGLVKLDVVALDGTKMKANASLSKNRTKDALTEEDARLEKEINDALIAGIKADEEEDRIYGHDKRGDEPPEFIRNAQKRRRFIRDGIARLAREEKDKVEAQEKKIEERQQKEKETGMKLRGRKPSSPDSMIDDEKKANMTDPDSRIMKTHSGFVQGYNGQAVVDCESQVIVGQAITTDENDVQQLAPMLNEVLLTTGTLPGMGTMDAGYWSEKGVQEAPPGIELFIATKKDWKQRKALQALPPPRGRIPSSATLRDRMERKLLTKRGRKIYKMRGKTVEPVFGQVKDARRLDRFLMRGKAKVSMEWSLMCTTHNILKLWKHQRKRWKKAAS
ncbi:MAG: IS1182 family transposase [Euryarchaeota archaeon]|nr:IS1182 family transposase [Euryarchaeota archaeon]MBU4032421.1 IS1182 family transposase [Candidatus Thermoplasmatota archaeon]MBU4071120.1 IS1182 family transposase [Candidatus Thermoplasmatota archaeon]